MKRKRTRSGKSSHKARRANRGKAAPTCAVAETGEDVTSEGAVSAEAGEDHEVAPPRLTEEYIAEDPPEDTVAGPDREALRQVGKEVLNQELDPEAWAQALAECCGTHDDALRHYAQIRTENLSQIQQGKREKIRELESRRRVSFRDFKEVEMLSRETEQSGIPGVIDSVYWHVLAGVGMAGSLLAARMLWPALLENIADSTLIIAILAMQLIPLVAWWAGSGRRGVVSYPGVTQLTACVALLASVLLSVQLFESGDRLLAEQSARPIVPPPSGELATVQAAENSTASAGAKTVGDSEAAALLAQSDEE